MGSCLMPACSIFHLFENETASFFTIRYHFKVQTVEVIDTESFSLDFAVLYFVSVNIINSSNYVDLYDYTH